MQLSDSQRGGERPRSKASSVLWLLLLGTTLSFLAAALTIAKVRNSLTDRQTLAMPIGV